MSEHTSHAERAKPPASFFVGNGVTVKVWPASGDQKYPNAVIEQSYQKEGSDEWVTNKVYIDNRALAALSIAAADAHREVNRQIQQNLKEGHSR
jgi:hypothetical protein